LFRLKSKGLLVCILVISFLASLLVPSQSSVLANEHPQPSRVKKMELLVMSGEEELKVIQTMIFSNESTDRVPFFIGLLDSFQEPYVLKGAPEEAEMEEQENGILLKNVDLPKGETVVVVGYTLPMGERTILPVLKQPFLIEKVDVLIEIKSLIVHSNNFLPQSSRETYGKSEFRRFTKLALAPHEPWRILFRTYKGNGVGGEPYQIAGEVTDPSLTVVTNVHEKNIPKSVFNIMIIIVILTVGITSIRRSTRGS
jgi:hypothetical protein